MAVDERTRHEMYSGLEEKLGAPVADALMAHLPPVGWADVATKQDIAGTKQDIAALATATQLDIAALAASTAQKFDQVNGRLDEMHRLMLWLFSTQLAVVGVMIAIAKVT